jgi:hypothetical protein
VANQRPIYLYAQSRRGGPLMHFTGQKFADYGEKFEFHTVKEAASTANYLLSANDNLRHYELTVRQYLGSKYKMNPLPVLLTFGSHVSTATDVIKNPSVRTTRRIKYAGQSAALRQSARLLKDFSGHDPSEVISLSEKPFHAGLVIGTLDAVPYTTVRDGKTEHYLHEFEKHARPLLVASSDGRSLRIVGGRFQFTEAGIVDDKK